MNDLHIIAIVEDLNSELFTLGIADHSFFSFGTDGNNSWIEFAGYPLWDRDNDDRPWIPGKEGGKDDYQEELDSWLRKQAGNLTLKLIPMAKYATDKQTT